MNNDAVQPRKCIELLKLCQQLQTEKDGIRRPEPGTFDPTAKMDTFASNITNSCLWLTHIETMLPVLEQITELGKELEREGKIQPEAGDNYASLAVAWLLAAKQQQNCDLLNQ
ncbi:hypothetical protein ACP26C_23815 (plasmid) [Franconibacter helveticus 513]|uniref:hypothetical protein n=1 Tax=Franconibacter TaxID=1649295 RepID=UPI0003F52F40|nr:MULTISPECIES: hypothetical protein [Franconibacter]